MMDDRTLLERAAKAAGLRAGNGLGEYAWHPTLECLSTLDERNREAPWNPLEDDGDEARLEAACGLNVLWGDTCVTVVHNLTDIGRTEFFADHNGDKQKARRRAGVRAAAEIGGE